MPAGTIKYAPDLKRPPPDSELSIHNIGSDSGSANPSSIVEPEVFSYSYNFCILALFKL